MHAFGRWEEAGVPGENPRIHGENMHTPHRKVVFIHTEPKKNKKRNFSSVQSPVLSMPEPTVERNDSLLTGRNLWQNQTQEGWPSSSTSWGLCGQKRGDNKHCNTIQRVPVGTGKQKLMTTIMSSVHNIIWEIKWGGGEQSEERCDRWGLQQSKPIVA